MVRNTGLDDQSKPIKITAIPCYVRVNREKIPINLRTYAAGSRPAQWQISGSGYHPKYFRLVAGDKNIDGSPLAVETF